MSGNRVLSRLALGLAAVLCSVLAAVTLVRQHHIGPGSLWSPSTPATQYQPRPDNPMPPRNRIRLQPDQFDAIVSRKTLTGTQFANIVLQPDRIDMLVGDRVAWSGAYRSVPGFDGRVSMADLARLVARSPAPDWLQETSPGVFLLKAGMVQAPGTRLEVTAPEVRELRLASAPNVFLAGVGATVLIKDTKVTSWLPANNGPDGNPSNHRPFVSYDDGGRMDIADSELSYLGTDASKAYGVSWGTGTTGEANKSVFHHNLFGAYTGRSVGVVFRGNVFRDNSRYGLDPHTDSSGLIVVDNEAYGNNTHGIIFSEHVHHSIIEGNRSHDNGVNGIMLDEKCDFNLIRNNEVWANRGDGIVIQGSSHAVVVNNQTSGNTVGIRINANNLGFTDGTRIALNTIRDNKRGIEVYGGARDTMTQGNKISNTADQAIEFSDPAISQSDTVSGARKAVTVHKVGATVRGLITSNVGRGVVVTGGARTTVESSQVTGRDIAIEVQPDSHIELVGTDGGALTTVSGARKGVVVNGTADLRDVAISDVSRGVLVQSSGSATITTTSIVTDNKGVEVEGFNGRGRVQLVASDVRAPDPLVGSTLWKESGNELSAIPSWLAVAGALFVVLASLLHVGHRLWAPMSRVRHEVHPTTEATGNSA